MNGKYDLNRNFFSLMKVIEDDMIRNCSREDSNLILESMLFVTELLTTETHCQQVMLIVLQDTLKKHLSPELDSGSVHYYSSHLR